MISVGQAISIVQNNTSATQRPELKKVDEAHRYILYKDVVSPINMPPFRQSAMDGYALNLHDEETYTVVGEIKAGDGHKTMLKKGEAIRIFTGAPVPDTANAVVMQERTHIENKVLHITSQVMAGENIRPLGEQVLKSQVALKKGTSLTPAALAFLKSLGIIEVSVFKKPTVAVVVTGNELIEVGQSLAYGQVYESNTTMLITALNGLGFQSVSAYKIDDDYLKTVSVLDQIISDHDMVIVSGGISVGDYDFVGKALREIHVEQLFYQVNQKPGKPLYFGKKGKKIIFALPGNPAAALSCFYVYIYPALQNMSGASNTSLQRTTAVSMSNYNIKGDRSQFLKAKYINGKVEILDGQNSSMLHTFALANALVYVNGISEAIKVNDAVEVILLPIH
ncbi:MAG TPA: gephyrin-like molybdotransferase Glp [Flavobacteriaceae bacterium]